MSVLVDTIAWFAISVPKAPQHQQISAWRYANHLPLVTTDYVIDETLTLLRARGHAERAIRFGRRVFDLAGIKIHYVQPAEIRLSWELFRDNPKRGWSFTDCTSRVVAERLHISRVLTFDQHFAEFGLFTLLP